MTAATESHKAADGVVAAALAGDQAAFATLVERHRRELQVHCYRMLGSFTDAEDMVQETFLRAWRRRETYAGRSTFRAWLYRIATNVCLDHLERHPRRPGRDGGVGEVTWLQPFPDQLLDQVAPPDAEPDAAIVARETIELAFLVAVQHLPPRQRAVLMLRDVLGWSAAESAAVLEASVASVNSALQRARALRDRLTTQPAPDRASGETARLARRYAAAWEAGDVDAIVAMLADDARYSMPPLPEWYAGRGAIREFLVTGPLASRWRFLPASANGMPAFGTYMWDGTAYVPKGLDVLKVSDGSVHEVVSFLDADFARFDLPPRITR
jgi:RNA polymerase sigma-70 factor (ECF subfamily)